MGSRDRLRRRGARARCWRKLVTISVPPAALDARIFSDYKQLERFFYVFFMKTARAEAVIAAGDMAFLDRALGGLVARL